MDIISSFADFWDEKITKIASKNATLKVWFIKIFLPEGRGDPFSWTPYTPRSRDPTGRAPGNMALWSAKVARRAIVPPFSTLSEHAPVRKKESSTVTFLYEVAVGAAVSKN